jgi:DNA-binding MarR family transcriptional regulator
MDASIDFQLILALMNGRISNMLRNKISEDLESAHIEITSEQWDVLLAISLTDTCTQQQLCKATSYNKSKMTRLLNDMADAGIIIRDKSRVDWRSNYIRITRKGGAIYDKAKVIALRSLQDSLQGLTHNEIYIAQKSLNQVLNNLRQISLNKKQEEAEIEEALRKRREKLIRKLILHKNKP